MTPAEGERLRRAIAALLEADLDDFEVTKLGGGVSNASYCVARAEERYVVRLKGGTVGATLGLVEEFELLRTVAAAGITAEPLRMDPGSGALLTRFVPGAATWTTEAAREERNVGRAADLLRRLHGVPAKLREFAPTGYAEKYFAAAAARERLGAREKRLSVELRELTRDYESTYSASVVCHNDLVAANILDEGGELKLVDFEYAALASPVLDLASLAAMNEFDRSERRELLHAYFMTAAAPISVEEFAKVVRMAQLMAYFWALAAPQEMPDSRYLDITESE